MPKNVREFRRCPKPKREENAIYMDENE